ncbi:hypothetical protein MA16_Dca006244 [Dendrobium catenatum]|uniref:Uncharacterized protein n=1 Tax=Dendrobium catenatum TaxID=906689 RepID=A0A2I0W9B6_9ASPA|nr:hypothetical protein MA16_Dca006244 [Dendrobium catenatum]
MEGRRLAPSEAWANIRRGFNAPVRSSEVFKGSQISASGFNSFPKQKPLIIREGGLLNKVVNPVPVGKGKESLIVGDFLSPRKSVPSTCCKVNSIILNEGASSSSGKIIFNDGFKSVSLPSSPMVFNSGKKTGQEDIKSNDDKVLDDFPPLVSIDSENKKKFVDVLNVPSEGHIEVSAAWKKKQNIRVDNLDIGSFLSNDGNSVRLHSENEANNTLKLRNALIIKNADLEELHELGPGCGLIIASFYYVCFSCSDGSINDFYYDPNIRFVSPIKFPYLKNYNIYASNLIIPFCKSNMETDIFEIVEEETELSLLHPSSELFQENEDLMDRMECFSLPNETIFEGLFPAIFRTGGFPMVHTAGGLWQSYRRSGGEIFGQRELVGGRRERLNRERAEEMGATIYRERERRMQVNEMQGWGQLNLGQFSTAFRISLVKIFQGDPVLCRHLRSVNNRRFSAYTWKV